MSKIIKGVDITAVRGKKEFLLMRLMASDYFDVKIPDGYDIVIEPILEDKKQNKFMWFIKDIFNKN